MYPERFVNYLNLSAIPEHITNTISLQHKDYKFESGKHWTDTHNQLVNDWCQKTSVLIRDNVLHRVCGIQSGQTRFSITAKIF
jgi:hypothetical protein